MHVRFTLMRFVVVGVYVAAVVCLACQVETKRAWFKVFERREKAIATYTARQNEGRSTDGLSVRAVIAHQDRLVLFKSSAISSPKANTGKSNLIESRSRFD